MTMTLVSTVTVGAGGAASIDFTSIPQTGTDLLIVLSGRDNNTMNPNGYRLWVNPTTSYTIGGKTLRGNGTTVYSGSSSGTSNYNLLGAANNTNAATANTFSNASVYITNYTSTNTKTMSVDSVSENNATEAWIYMDAVSAAVSSAITSLTFKSAAGDTLLQYSSISLYTITKGSGGATVS